MTPEQTLAIAASQWVGIPTPEQIIKALAAGGFKVVSASDDRHDDGRDNEDAASDVTDDPVAFVRSVIARRKISANKLAAKAGIAASTLNRALNNPKHTCILSTRTLQKIRQWDAGQ